MTSCLRIGIVADGDPSARGTNSGVSKGLVDALSRRPDVEIAGLVDSSPTRAQSYLLAALSWRPSSTAWRNQKRKGSLATWVRSRNRDRAFARLGTPDLIIHVRNTYLPAKTPYVVFIDGTASLSQRYWPEWRMTPRAYRKRVSQELDYFSKSILVATAGKHAANEVVDFYGQERRRVATVGGGTNMSSAPSRPEARQGRGDGRISFLFVGKDFERKGGPELLEAFARLRAAGHEASLTVIGPESRAPELADGVDWRGYVGDPEEMASAYKDADVFCLPSRYEPYGLVIQEALNFGLPCIVSDRGALPEIVGDAGLVVTAESAESIFEAMKELVSNCELRRELRAAAPSRLAGMSWDAVGERMITALRELDLPREIST